MPRSGSRSRISPASGRGPPGRPVPPLPAGSRPLGLVTPLALLRPFGPPGLGPSRNARPRSVPCPRPPVSAARSASVSAGAARKASAGGPQQVGGVGRRGAEHVDHGVDRAEGGQFAGGGGIAVTAERLGHRVVRRQRGERAFQPADGTRDGHRVVGDRLRAQFPQRVGDLAGGRRRRGPVTTVVQCRSRSPSSSSDVMRPLLPAVGRGPGPGCPGGRSRPRCRAGRGGPP